MIEVCHTYEGDLPLLISVPHDGCHVPKDIRDRMTPIGLALPDTDWHVAELYDFARDLGASMQIANYSRYVVDLNRSATDDVLYPGQVVTGLCPLTTFSGEEIYSVGHVTDEEKVERIADYWQPYHARIESTLASIRAKHGYALLWDAHSIPSVVPRLFDGELPELNVGTNGGKSCAATIEAAVVDAAAASTYSMAVNDRFKGGYIIRHYGNPVNRVHALQLEIAQRAYLDEAATEFDAEKAGRLRLTLRRLLEAFLNAAR
ncbi:MAG: N-formylglutamate deformylase [Gammaproteobacteria bacterium]|nr:N-formylglutamate deformylase [Gammaproteobacteria bacterium]